MRTLERRLTAWWQSSFDRRPWLSQGGGGRARLLSRRTSNRRPGQERAMFQTRRRDRYMNEPTILTCTPPPPNSTHCTSRVMTFLLRSLAFCLVVSLLFFGTSAYGQVRGIYLLVRVNTN